MTEVIQEAAPKVIEIKNPEVTYPVEACNCYRYVKNRIDDLPRMVNIIPNTDPYVGAVAIEWFGKIKHVSIVTAVLPDGVEVMESNFHHCKTGTRFIPFGKYSLSGFWGPGK